MPIITEQVTASAELNDQYGVTVWQAKKRFDYTAGQARTFANEILAASDEADSCIAEDRKAVAAKADYPKPGPDRHARRYPF